MALTLADTSFRELLSAFAAAEPTPGGGSACAAAAAMAVALLTKAALVAGLPHHKLAGINTQLAGAIDEDAMAYREVIAARRQPRDTEEDRALRAAAIQQALRHATDVPLTIMRLSAEALDEAHTLASRIHRSTMADALVAVVLLRASFDGARATVHANLGGLRNAEDAATIREESTRLSDRATLGSGEAERLLRLG